MLNMLLIPVVSRLIKGGEMESLGGVGVEFSL